MSCIVSEFRNETGGRSAAGAVRVIPAERAHFDGIRNALIPATILIGRLRCGSYGLIYLNPARWSRLAPRSMLFV